MRSISIFTALAFAAFANAQTSTTTTTTTATGVVSSVSSASTSGASGTATVTGSTQSQSMPAIATQGFNINNITSEQKRSWCDGQYNSCREICGSDGTLDNVCEDSDLTYSCTCSNGTVPDCTRYTETIPFYICQATFRQCNDNHPDDLQGKMQCEANAQCGTIQLQTNDSNPTTTSSDGNNPTSSGSAPSSSSSAPGGNAAIALNPSVVTGIFAALLMSAFRLFL